MKTYRVYTKATALIEEVWEVNADSPDEAEDMVYGGEVKTLVSEHVLGDETDREVTRVEEEPT